LNGVAGYPDLPALTRGLQAALELPDGVAVVQRVPNRRPHTFPSEVVKCRLADGRELSLFAKYQAGAGNPAHGHRGGVAYEADVYRHVLRSSSSSTPRFHGSYSDVDAGETWLVIEYLDGGQRVVDTTAPKQAGGQPRVGAMPLAAAWLGHFHSEHEAERDPAACLLTIYDGDYYTGWARRTALLAADWRDSFPWLATLCMRGAEAMTVLQGTPLTVVHGEFYPGNVLIRNGTVYPIDWESAAVAAGEIDLAALIEHWPVEIARRCIRAYCEARWPRGTPSDFDVRLRTACLYLHLRWLGDQPEWVTHPRFFWRFEDLRDLGQQLDLV